MESEGWSIINSLRIYVVHVYQPWETTLIPVGFETYTVRIGAGGREERPERDKCVHAGLRPLEYLPTN